MRAFLWMLMALGCVTVLWGSALLREPRVVTVAQGTAAEAAAAVVTEPSPAQVPESPSDLMPAPSPGLSPSAELAPQQTSPVSHTPVTVPTKPVPAPHEVARGAVPINGEWVKTNVRRALGSPAASIAGADILVQGTTQLGDTAGKFSLLFNPQGCYLQEVEGPITVAAGFDGHASWALASTAEKGYGGGDIALPEGLIAVVTGRWAAVDAPCAVRAEGTDQSSDTLTVCLTPDGGGPPYYVELDCATWVPLSVYWMRSGVRDTWNLADFRRDLGVLLPHRLNRVHGTQTDTYEITRVTPAPDFTENPYRPAGLRLARIRSQPEETAAASPMRG